MNLIHFNSLYILCSRSKPPHILSLYGVMHSDVHHFGADGFIKKPFDLHKMLHIIDRELSWWYALYLGSKTFLIQLEFEAYSLYQVTGLDFVLPAYLPSKTPFSILDYPELYLSYSWVIPDIYLSYTWSPPTILLSNASVTPHLLLICPRESCTLVPWIFFLLLPQQIINFN